MTYQMFNFILYMVACVVLCGRALLLIFVEMPRHEKLYREFEELRAKNDVYKKI